MSDDVSYTWAEPRFNRFDPERIGPEVERILGKHGTDAARVVEAAKDPASPLHEWFEWDDTKAAHEYRLEQARLLLRSIRVASVEQPEPVRLAFAVRRAPNEPRDYVPRETVRSDPELRAQVIATAKRELASWSKRYEQIRGDLAPVFDAIEHIFDERDAAE